MARRPQEETLKRMTRTVAQQRGPFNLHMFLPSIILQAVCLILLYAAWLLKKVKTINFKVF